MNNNIVKWLLIAIVLPLFAACSWEDLPSYEDANITGVQFYYRWASTTDKDPITGEPMVRQQLLGTKANINAETGTVTCEVTLPATNGTFTEEVRNGVSQDNLVCQVTLSTAARLTPVGGSKQLGVPDNWTTEHQYLVTAANGDTKTWTIKVTALNK